MTNLDWETKEMQDDEAFQKWLQDIDNELTNTYALEQMLTHQAEQMENYHEGR